ncbi:MAG: EF-hand domain-containing protein, partial [Armatimonadetes bacterium]|nr:EF-hand domain-containing protein [Armatimonadota bacterium]
MGTPSGRCGAVNRSGAVVMTSLVALMWAAFCAGQQPGGQVTIEQRFRQLDRNGDGKLTAQELPGEWFGRLDTNKDSVVTLEEAKAAVAGARPAMGGPARPTQVH